MSRTYIRPNRANVRKIEDFILNNRERLQKMNGIAAATRAVAKEFAGQFEFSDKTVYNTMRSLGVRVKRKRHVSRQVAPTTVAASSAKPDPIDLVAQCLTVLNSRSEALRDAVIGLYQGLGIISELPESLKIKE